MTEYNCMSFFYKVPCQLSPGCHYSRNQSYFPLQAIEYLTLLPKTVTTLNWHTTSWGAIRQLSKISLEWLQQSVINDLSWEASVKARKVNYKLACKRVFQKGSATKFISCVTDFGGSVLPWEVQAKSRIHQDNLRYCIYEVYTILPLVTPMTCDPNKTQ